jgi:SNF2 family DNA or RNA helicase
LTIDINAIEKACKSSIWKTSKGKLKKAKVVLIDNNIDYYKIAVDYLDITNTVWIYSDQTWECTCLSPVDPCIHTALSAWAIRNEELIEPDGTAHFGYRFIEVRGLGLQLFRAIVTGSKEENYIGPAIRAPEVIPTELDLDIEQLLGNSFGTKSIVPKGLMRDLLGLMSQKIDIDVKINGNSIKVSGEYAYPLCLVREGKGGFVVRLVRDPKISAIFSGGTVICNGKLRMFSRGLQDFTYQRLAKGIVYSIEDIEKLVCETLPNIRKKIPVIIQTNKLPSVKETKPYILFETSYRIDDLEIIQNLVVKTQLVYGNPPIAEVKGRKLKRRTNLIPIRDIKQEERLLSMYKSLSESKLFPLGLEKEFAVDNIVNIVSLLRKVSQQRKHVVVSGVAKDINVVEVTEPIIFIEDENIEVNWGGATEEEVFQAWQRNQKNILLQNGTVMPLPLEWLDEYGHIVSEILAAKKLINGKRLPKYSLFDLARLCEKLNRPPPPSLEGLRNLVNNFSGIPDCILPSDLKATLRDYQMDGVKWLSFLKEASIGGILADDMGLGKTVQALCVLEKQSLVVAPTSVLHNWMLEAKKFRPELVVHMYHGTHRKLNKDADVILTSYAILRNDIEILRNEIWTVVVLDEAQAIKNPKSYTAQAAFSLQSKFRLAMTGTPIENRLNELWSQMHFLCPGFLGGERDFYRNYEAPILDGQTDVIVNLRNKIRPFVLRRIKRDVAPELPPRTDITLMCPLSEEERVIYDAIRVSTQEHIVKTIEEGKFNVMTALEALLRLRQASCHSGLLPNLEAEVSSKVTLLIEKLNEVINSGHKALVFSQWTQFLDRIEPHLNSNKIGFIRLDGSTRNRQHVVQEFQRKEGPPIFLSSLKAGGTGLNLTEADHVFIMDPWWNPAVEDQAADRAHRIGQENPVLVYRLVADKTVEERILLLQERKRALADAALSGTTKVETITKEDLLALLQ